METLLGLSVSELLFALALLLFLSDLFFASEILTLVSYALAATAMVWPLEMHVLYRASFGIVAFFGLAIFHAFIWRQLVQRFINRYAAPKRFRDINERLIGAAGTITVIDGQTFVQVLDEQWPVDPESSLNEGRSVRVVGRRDSRLVVVNDEF